MWLPLLMVALCGARALAATTEPAWKKEADLLFGKPSTTAASGSDDDFNLQPGGGGGSGGAPEAVTKCKMEDGSTGECVVYYQCNSDTKNLITDGTTLIDIRIKERPCPQYLHTCCGRADVNRTKPTVPVGGNGACGYSNPGASGEAFRISSTEYAEFAEFPWMVAILKKTAENVTFTPKIYLGGGSLIHPRLVLTSAHKVDALDEGAVMVRAGEWDSQTEEETFPYQQRDVRKIIVHEDFYRPSVLNSVALLLLESPFELAPHVDVVCLGHVPPPPGTPCVSMGWGKEDFGDADKYAVFLKKVPLPLVSREKCQTALRGTRVGSYFVLHKSFTCAGGKPGVDTCRGDGGAPLVCNIGPGRFAQYGVVAWGIGCGEEGVPGVYTEVTQFRAWIVERAREEGLKSDSFDYTEP